MAHILLLSDGKTAHVAGGLGISEEQSDPVHMAARNFEANQIEAYL